MEIVINTSLAKNKPPTFSYFIASCGLMLVLQAAFQYLLFSENLYFNALQTQLSYEQIERIITQGKKWQWVGYVLTPILLLMKFSFFAACLSLGLYFASNRFAFKPFWNFLVQAELIFLLPILIKLLWFLFVQTDYDLDDLTQFYPLSALNLFDADTLPRYWHYPLATLNLFEVAYWFLLAYGVNEVTDLSFWRAFGLVMSSYGLGLLVWVVLVMFLTITYA